MTTIETLVPGQLWQAIQPLLLTPPPRHGGRPRIDDRAALAGIVYQLRTGIPWQTAQLLRLSRSAAYRRIEAGQIEAFKLGERWFVPTAPLKRKLGLS